MRANQTGNYLNFKEDFERALSTVNTDGPRDFRLNVDITTPDDSRTTGILSYFWHLRCTCSVESMLVFFNASATFLVTKTAWHCVNAGHKGKRFSLHAKMEFTVLPRSLINFSEFSFSIVRNYKSTIFQSFKGLFL